MPSVGYFSPLGYEGTLPNQIVYGLSHVLADQKFMAIFSMLFGASTILFVEGAQKKGKRATLLFYVRNFWLLVIGLIHSTYIWFGDVLVVYALCSFVLYFLRNISPKKQLVLGLLIYLLPSMVNIGLHQGVIDKLDPVEHVAFVEHWSPSEASLQEELEVFRGSYADQNAFRAELFQPSEDLQDGHLGNALLGLSFALDVFARAFGMMLVGIAFFRWGVFSNTLPGPVYRKMVRYGLGFGIPLSVLGLVLSYASGWDWRYSQFIGRLPNTLATPGIALGYIALVMLCLQGGHAPGLQQRLQAVGKTALSAYLLQSLIATTIFYGFGLGLFGHVSRIGQLGIMVLIWAMLLSAAPRWLTRFQFGPLEWVWRCLTYMKWLPIRRREA